MPTRLRLLLVALLATAGSPTLPAAGGQSDRLDAPVTLAVVRRDGILVPFATWDGRRWGNSWPVPDKSASTPITTDAIPRRWWGRGGPVPEWHVWQVDGSQSTALIKRPTWYLAHCQQGVGLVSSLNLRGPLPPPVIQPYPKMGLASSVPVKFSPIAVMGAESAVWKAVPAAIEDRLTAEENALITRLAATGWKHPIDESHRGVDIQVESLFRAPLGDGRFLYYFEAVKRYTEIQRPRERADDAPSREAGRRGPECELLTFANGWFVAGNNDTRVSVASLSVKLTSCDFADVDVVLPLAYVRGADGPVWIVQLSGWGRERFALIAWNTAQAAPTVLFAAPGGECPRVE